MSKIAPRVTEAVECYWISSETEDGRQARSELRALLAVARAARRADAVRFRDGPECVAVMRALSRLSRASSAGRGKT